MKKDLFSPYERGALALPNRAVMAPLTRSRAIEGDVPNPLAITYYTQRAGAGLIISEGSPVSPQGVGYIRTPGIYTSEQVAGWKKVTSAVHQAGGRIFIQLWHVGRVSHPDFHGGELPVAPSAIAPEGESYTPAGRKKIVTPRALELSEIAGVVDQFKRAAENAKLAGFDGVEIHGANGYLLDQFMRDGSNHRGDRYGGSIANRARFPLEVTEAVIGVWGPERVGYRVSPTKEVYSAKDSHPGESFGYLARELSALKLGYLHISEPIAGYGAPLPGVERVDAILRREFDGTYIVNGGYDLATANQAIETGSADLVAFGVPFIANPDLVERWKRNAPLNPVDSSTFYMGEEKGYVDYPSLRD